MNRRKGRKLAVALPPRWPRWGALLGSTIITLTLVMLCVAYCRSGRSDPTLLRPHRLGIMGVLIGLPALFCILYGVRDAALWLVAGETRVEIDREPALAGRPLEVLVVQSRDHSSLLRLEARQVCRRTRGREEAEELLSIPLGDTAADRQGRKAQLESRVTIPSDGLPSSLVAGVAVEWSVEVRAAFKSRRVFRNDHPFAVAAG